MMDLRHTANSDIVALDSLHYMEAREAVCIRLCRVRWLEVTTRHTVPGPRIGDLGGDGLACTQQNYMKVRSGRN